MFFSRSSHYSLRKSRHILKTVYAWYKKKGNTLSDSHKQHLEAEMRSLDEALLAGQKERASDLAKSLERFSEVHCKKTFWEYGYELALALIFALAIASLIRMTWFEPYEIPTGSMRPTFKEKDHLIVTKTAFGINMPMATDHVYFDPNLVQRTSVVIFSGDNLPMNDVDTTYFGLFPYKKRYIKREIAKPGDSIYFYGGKLYGVDKAGNEITELRDSPWMQDLEHIPFITFEGVPSATSNGILFKQMNLPAGKLTFNVQGQMQGEVFDGKKWVKDRPLAQKQPHDQIETYSDLLGIRNYAEARLLTKEQLKQFAKDTEGLEDGVLYLQLQHTPSLTYPKPALTREGRGNGIYVTGYTTVIPLQQKHVDALMDALYTARFVVSNERSKRYSLDNGQSFDGPRFSGVPDGTYEFYFGKASQIKWGGISSPVSQDSPLYSHDPRNVQKLFNMGIEMNLAFAPHPQFPNLFPHRYAYFRDGDLYLMGAPIIKKDDQTLVDFHKKEQERQDKASENEPYVAFRDYGPPLKDGKIDAEFIRTFGVTLPEGQYLVLGDNHAMSSDSRVFGFVPQANLQGAPSWIIWPPGERLGEPAQKPYPFMNLPRAIVWGLAALIGLIWYLIHRRNLRRPIFKIQHQEKEKQTRI